MLPYFATTAIWLIGITVIALILLRPRGISEYVWATAGAMLLVGTRLVSLPQAIVSIRQGTNVYLFLIGMMLLAEIAKLHGVFDWLAALALQKAAGSRFRLFCLIYAVGVLVTSLLSNDATAVVLTPAVLVVVRRCRVSPMPYLFACAVVANAASFVLPISNPANLVVYAQQVPSLVPWLHIFLLPAVVAIAVTFILLAFIFRRDLTGDIGGEVVAAPLNAPGKRAAWGILFAAVVLLLASALDKPLGLPTCATAMVILLVVSGRNLRSLRTALAEISWGVLPLVAGLFVLVGALDHAGALPLAIAALHRFAAWNPYLGALTTAGCAGLSANVLNNLPVGLIGAAAIQGAGLASTLLHAAVLLGIDLGPNLSVTGSLATILWLMALRRENINVSAGSFLRVGLLVMPPVLLLAVLTLVLCAH